MPPRRFTCDACGYTWRVEASDAVEVEEAAPDPAAGADVEEALPEEEEITHCPSCGAEVLFSD